MANLDLCLLFARATLLVFGWLARLGLFCGHGAGRDEAYLSHSSQVTSN